MCIACELGLMLALDEFPDGPPPGFPRTPAAGEAAGYACDAPDGDAPQPDASPKVEPKP